MHFIESLKKYRFTLRCVTWRKSVQISSSPYNLSNITQTFFKTIFSFRKDWIMFILKHEKVVLGLEKNKSITLELLKTFFFRKQKQRRDLTSFVSRDDIRWRGRITRETIKYACTQTYRLVKRIIRHKRVVGYRCAPAIILYKHEKRLADTTRLP